MNWESSQGYEEKNIADIRFSMINPNSCLSSSPLPFIFLLTMRCGFKKVFQFLDKGLA
jgi:hypothetical protein